MWNTFRIGRKIRIGNLIRHGLWVIIEIEGKFHSKSGRTRLRTPFLKHKIKDTGIKSYMKFERTVREREREETERRHYSFNQS